MGQDYSNNSHECIVGERWVYHNMLHFLYQLECCLHVYHMIMKSSSWQLSGPLHWHSTTTETAASSCTQAGVLNPSLATFPTNRHTLPLMWHTSAPTVLQQLSLPFITSHTVLPSYCHNPLNGITPPSHPIQPLPTPSYLHEFITLWLDAIHEWSDDGVEFSREGGDSDKGACYAAVNMSLYPLVFLL